MNVNRNAPLNSKFNDFHQTRYCVWVSCLHCDWIWWQYQYEYFLTKGKWHWV